MSIRCRKTVAVLLGLLLSLLRFTLRRLCRWFTFSDFVIAAGSLIDNIYFKLCVNIKIFTQCLL